jgi:hypothetical protein
MIIGSWLHVTVLVLAVTQVALLVLVIMGGRRVARLQSRYDQLVAGSETGSLDQRLQQQTQSVQTALATAQEIAAAVARTEGMVSDAIQRVGLYRFNPFSDTGGELSFALALTDDSGKGVVLCSLHSRGETRLYAKPLHIWDSPYSLSQEEQEAVRRARNGRSDEQ